MFDYPGLSEVAQRIIQSLEMTISQKIVTYDPARQMEGAMKVKCSDFASLLIENI